MTKAPKATKKDLYMREVDIITMLQEGHTVKHISDVLAEKWKVTPRSIDRQYRRIMREARDAMIEDRKDLAANLIQRYELIYKRCLAEGKLKTAIDALNSIGKTAGISQNFEAKSKKPEIITIKQEDQSKPKLVPMNKDKDSVNE